MFLLHALAAAVPSRTAAIAAVGLALVTVPRAAPVRAADAQQPTAAPGAIRVGVDYVQVDVSVTDPQGRFVRDLGIDAFELYEDGRPQKVSTFSLVDLAAPPRLSGGEAPVVAAEPDVRSNAPDSAGRVYVIVLDDLHVDPLRSHRVRQAARQFVERHFGPNDIAAVLHTSGRADASQDFTTRPLLLLQAIDRFVGQKMRSSVLERLAEYERRRGERTSADIRLERIVDPADAQRADQARRALRTLAGIGDVLAQTEARRKALVLFSEGISYPLDEGITQTSSGVSTFTNPYAADIRRDLQQAIRAAARATVSVYPIDPRGLPGGDDTIEVTTFPENPHLGLTPTAFQDEVRQAQDSLRIIAEQTGGVASLASNDFAAAFDRIVRDSGTYYLLGYRSTDTRRDSRFRRIEVRVARQGVRVRARSGYVAASAAETPPAPLTADVEPSEALRQVLNAPLPGGALPMRVFAAPFGGEKMPSVSVGIEIDARSFRFVEEKGLQIGRVDVAVVAFDRGARFKGGDRQVVRLQLKPETHRAVQTHGLRVMFRLKLPPGRYQLRAAAHEPATGAAGSVFYDVDVPDFAAAPLAMSGVVLTAARAAQMATARMDPLFQGVLQSPPTALRIFRAEETLTALVEVYGTADATRAGFDLLTTVRGVDGRVRFSTAVQSAADERAAQDGAAGYAIGVPLTGLPPGSYTLRIEARPRTGKEQIAFRELPFEIGAFER